jgi:hypothetical protein
MVKLSKNHIFARTRLDNLGLVNNLNCWGSDLDDISLVAQLPNVRVLSLSVNKIHSLAALTQCPCLEELYLRKNDVASLDEIMYLRDLPSLRVLWLAENPLAEVQYYRYLILTLLPQLDKLDDKIITNDERIEADRVLNSDYSLESGNALPDPEASMPSFPTQPAADNARLLSVAHDDASSLGMHASPLRPAGGLVRTPPAERDLPSSRSNYEPPPMLYDMRPASVMEEAPVVSRAVSRHEVSAAPFAPAAGEGIDTAEAGEIDRKKEKEDASPVIPGENMEKMLDASLLLIQCLDEVSLRTLKHAIDMELNRYRLVRR